MTKISAQDHYLFISNNCQHSRRLMQQLKQSPLVLNSFTIVNVDDPNIQLPQFVKCVPTLYISNKRYVLTDDDLFNWFQDKLSNDSLPSTTNTVSNNNINIDSDNNILPFHISEMGNALAGSSYSFLEDNNNNIITKNFSPVQTNAIDNNSQQINFTFQHQQQQPQQQQQLHHYNQQSQHQQPQQQNILSNKGAGMQQRKTGGNTDQAYENLMKSRNIDVPQRAIPQQTPNFSSPF